MLHRNFAEFQDHGMFNLCGSYLNYIHEWNSNSSLQSVLFDVLVVFVVFHIVARLVDLGHMCCNLVVLVPGSVESAACTLGCICLGQVAVVHDSVFVYSTWVASDFDVVDWTSYVLPA